MGESTIRQPVAGFGRLSTTGRAASKAAAQNARCGLWCAERGGGFDEGPAETEAKCLCGPDPLRCPATEMQCPRSVSPLGARQVPILGSPLVIRSRSAAAGSGRSEITNHASPGGRRSMTSGSRDECTIAHSPSRLVETVLGLRVEGGARLESFGTTKRSACSAAIERAIRRNRAPLAS
jgi:hypothetical protein